METDQFPAARYPCNELWMRSRATMRHYAHYKDLLSHVRTKENIGSQRLGTAAFDRPTVATSKAQQSCLSKCACTGMIRAHIRHRSGASIRSRWQLCYLQPAIAPRIANDLLRHFEGPNHRDTNIEPPIFVIRQTSVEARVQGVRHYSCNILSNQVGLAVGLERDAAVPVTVHYSGVGAVHR